MSDNKDEVKVEKVEIYLTSSEYRLLGIAAHHFAEVSDIPRTADMMATVYVRQALANIKRAMRLGNVDQETKVEGWID